ncbi:MAG: VCBS repeat-containing protein, partial [Verrucomicrobiota bacterium]
MNGLGAADSDGDGDTDFFVSMANGTFAFVENLELHTVPGAILAGSSNVSGISGLQSADFDLNGREDVVATGNERLWFLYTQANGLPGTPVFKLTQGASPHSAATADFDADGRPEVAYTLPTTGAVRVTRNNGDVPFSWTDIAIATGETSVSLLATGSASKTNGRPDLFSYRSDRKIRGHSQSGTGTWSSYDIVTLTTPGAQALAVGQHHTPAPGDEIAFIGSTNAGSSSSLRVGGAQLSFGWGTLGGTGQIESGPYQDRKLVWADTTGDDFKEVVYINGDGGLSAWNPTTLAVTVLGTDPSAIRDIVAVDWDRDGRTDILAATATGLTVYHFQRARQTWLRSEIYRTPANNDGYDFVSALDLNRDGNPDAVAFNRYGRLDYIHNAPNYLRADLSSLPATVNLVAGMTTDPIIIPLISGARAVDSGGLADYSAAVNRLELKFHEAVSGPGGTWT